MSVALVAGEGALPDEIASRLASNGENPVVYALRENCEALELYADTVIPVFKTELAATLKDMLERRVEKVMFAGLVPKTLMHRP